MKIKRLNLNNLRCSDALNFAVCAMTFPQNIKIWLLRHECKSQKVWIGFDKQCTHYVIVKIDKDCLFSYFLDNSCWPQWLQTQLADPGWLQNYKPVQNDRKATRKLTKSKSCEGHENVGWWSCVIRVGIKSWRTSFLNSREPPNDGCNIWNLSLSSELPRVKLSSWLQFQRRFWCGTLWKFSCNFSHALDVMLWKFPATRGMLRCATSIYTCVIRGVGSEGQKYILGWDARQELVEVK